MMRRQLTDQGIAKLLLELKQPDLEDVWLEGYEQSQATTIEENPYLPETPEYQFWREGWWAAFHGEAPFFDDEGIQSNDLIPSWQERLKTVGQLMGGLLCGSALVAICVELAS